MPLRLRGVEVKPYIVNEAHVTGASLYDNGAYVTRFKLGSSERLSFYAYRIVTMPVRLIFII